MQQCPSSCIETLLKVIYHLFDAILHSVDARVEDTGDPGGELRGAGEKGLACGGLKEGKEAVDLRLGESGGVSVDVHGLGFVPVEEVMNERDDRFVAIVDGFLVGG